MESDENAKKLKDKWIHQKEPGTKSLARLMAYVNCHGELIRSSDKLFRNHDFFSEKIIVVPQEGEIPPPLAQMVLTRAGK